MIAASLLFLSWAIFGNHHNSSYHLSNEPVQDYSSMIIPFLQ